MKYLGRSVCCVCCISLAIDGSRIAIRVSRRAHRPAAPLRAPCARFEQTSDDKRRSGVIGSERVQHFGVKKKRTCWDSVNTTLRAYTRVCRINEKLPRSQTGRRRRAARPEQGLSFNVETLLEHLF